MLPRSRFLLPGRPRAMGPQQCARKEHTEVKHLATFDGVSYSCATRRSSLLGKLTPTTLLFEAKDCGSSHAKCVVSRWLQMLHRASNSQTLRAELVLLPIRQACHRAVPWTEAWWHLAPVWSKAALVLLLVVRMLLVAMPGAPSSVLALSKARSP